MNDEEREQIPEDAEASSPERGVLARSIKEITDPFVALATAPRALWGIYIPYVLEGLVYFGILTILGKYLSENVGLKDLHAGWVYSATTGGITLAMLFLGGVTDKIGVRASLILSLGVMVIGRFFLGASGSFFTHGLGAGSPMFFMVMTGLLFVVVGYGLYQPAAYAGVKRFTDEKTATMAYAMLYGLMNLGAFFSGILSPSVRQSSGIVSVYWVYVVLTAVAFVASILILTRATVKRDTLTNIDVERSDDNGKSGAEEKKEGKKKPAEPLLTPTFAALVAGAIAALVTVAYLAMNAAGTPAEEGFDTLSEGYKAALKAIPDEPALGDSEAKPVDYAAVASKLRPHAEAAAAAAATVVAPAASSLPDGSEVDDDTMALLRRIAVRRAAWLQSTVADEAALSEKLTPGDKVAKSIRAEARALGILHMAVAYALVSDVNTEVVESLQLRMKLPEEDRIPLSAGRLEEIVAIASQKGPQMLRKASRATRDAVAAIEKTAQGEASLLARWIRLGAEDLEDSAKVLASSEEETLPAAVKAHSLASSVFLIKTLAPALAAEEGDEEVRKLSGLAFAGLALSAEQHSSVEAAELSRAAVRVPFAKGFAKWFWRYGLLLLAALVLVLMIGGSLLSKRPEHPFHDARFVFFIFVLIPVQTLFAHNWLTLPYYIDRAFGGTTVGDNFEFFSNLNPILIFFLAPIVAAMTAKKKVYTMMIAGTLVMAAPTFLLVLAPNPTLLLTYILLMSIGEAMWQPRFLQWVAEIAPEGQTGAYMGIAQFPWFLTKVIAGLYSGYFLARYCPVVGPQNTEMLWLIYALIAMASPLGLVMAKGWMQRAKKATV